MDQLTLEWPDLLDSSLNHWSVFLRKGDWLRAESLLLSQISCNPDDAILLASLSFAYAQNKLHHKARLVFDKFKRFDSQSFHKQNLLLTLLLWPANAQCVDPSSDLDEDDTWSLMTWVASCQIALHQGKPVLMRQLLNRLDHLDYPEIRVARAWYFRASGRLEDAYQQLLPVFKRAPNLLQPVVLGLEVAMQGQMGDAVIPALRSAIAANGEHPSLLGFVTTANLLRRQYGLARRSSLLERCWASIDGRKTHVDNHINTYENNGLGLWLEHLHSSLNCTSDDLLDYHRINLHANRALQLASIASLKSFDHLTSYLPILRESSNQSSLLRKCGPCQHVILNPESLHIIWLTSDFGFHPVGRFLLSFLESVNQPLRHKHTVVSTQKRSDGFGERLRTSRVARFVDLSGYVGAQRVSAIRRLKPDVVIDLNGWTSGQVINELMARLAPIQVNYLGYFATTGLQEIDYWLGDSQLFPESMSEWHTESIWRLPRPFIAWQPSLHLPEAKANVTNPPTGSIRFGTFNHTRKFSDFTLRLWAQILSSIPDSKLVLKAHSSSDPSSLTLLYRRMHNAGLSTDRIIWLPLTATSEEHLQQYSEIDIALDCSPNGGCTTTCEALWMGVPVITLSGTHYVSRMSTSVLHAAGLSDWVADSSQSYIDIAKKYSLSLDYLRQNRQLWRSRLQTSPLGDAEDLFNALESAFTEMALSYRNQ